MEEKEKLKELIRDLLYELRIDEICLRLMSKGASPNIPIYLSCPEDPNYKSPLPVVQLSQNTAEKIQSIDIDWDWTGIIIDGVKYGKDDEIPGLQECDVDMKD